MISASTDATKCGMFTADCNDDNTNKNIEKFNVIDCIDYEWAWNYLYHQGVLE